MTGITEVWSSLSTSSLFWLTATLGCYLIGQRVYKLSGWLAIFNPVVVSIILMITLLKVTGTSYKTYFDGAQFIHFLLGPTTVALAVPLYDLRRQLAKKWLPILVGLVAGSVTAIVSAVLIAGALGASPETLASLAPKSVTTPVAMPIAQKLGGLPELSAAFVVLTGIIGSVSAGPLYRLLRIEGAAEQGFAIGVAAHGMGTSCAFQVSQENGAYGSLAIGLTALATAFVAPVLLPILLALFD